MFQIINDGQNIQSTNYWQTPHAKEGLVYLSANSGAWRLLVPAAAVGYLAEIKTGKSVTLENSMQGEGLIDVVFEDGTDSPFFIAIDRKQIDREFGKGTNGTNGTNIPFFVVVENGEIIKLLAKENI